MSIIAEQIILGIIQGIAEWLPVSSEGLLVLAKTNLFASELGLSLLVKEALFLHLGTLLAAVIYFRKDIFKILKSIKKYKPTNYENRKILRFLIIATIISGLVGILLLKLLEYFDTNMKLTGKIMTVMIGFLLLFTAYLQLRFRKSGIRKSSNINTEDTLTVGLAQGLAILPGISRSGTTVSAFLLRNFDKTQALKLSFLMSIPAVLVGNIVLNIGEVVFNIYSLIGLAFSFMFGYLTIHLLLRVSKKINFGIFVLIFAVLTIGSVFV